MSGQIVSYHNNGIISKIYSKMAGTILEFFENGQIQKFYKIREDKITDLYIEYYENGFYKEYFRFEHGKKNGSCQTYHPNGVLWKRYFYYYDLLHGLQVEYNKDGSIYSQEEFHYGKSISPQYIYYKGENKIQYIVIYEDYQRHSGRVSYYSKNQQILTTGPFRQYKKHGCYYRFSVNGDLSEKSFYKNGMLDGKFERYGKNGECYLRGIYKDGKRNGIFWKTDNCIIEQTRYKNDKRHGLFVLKNKKNFTKILSLFYRNDCLDGIQIFHTRKSKRYYRENYFITIQCKKFDSCSVCWSKCNWKTPCGHYLCLRCAQNIRQFQCPMCRNTFVKKTNPLFNMFGTENFLKQD